MIYQGRGKKINLFALWRVNIRRPRRSDLNTVAGLQCANAANDN
jgi:hypothetical protein